MQNQPKITCSLLSLFILFGALGCDRKNNPFLSTPGAGVNSVTLSIPQIDTTNTASVNRIFVLALDDLGNHITGFQLGNFSVLEGGNPGVPFEVGNVNEPLYLALVIDRSGSMGLALTAAANAAATDLINALGATDYAALVDFESDVTVTVGFTTDKTALTTAIAAGVAGGGTALYDATATGANLLNGQKGRRMLLVLTDGDDTASSSTLAESIAAVNAAGLSANMVGLGSFFNSNALQQMADETSGTYATSVDGTDLDGPGGTFLTILARFEDLSFVRYRRRSRGNITVFLNYGALTASTSKTLD